MAPLPGTAADCGVPGFEGPRLFALKGDPRTVAIADFNRDSHPDIVVGLHALPTAAGPIGGGVSVLMGAGDGTVLPPTHYPVSTRLSCLVARDFNHDGIPDVALGADADPSSESVFLLLGNPDGTFQPATGHHAGPRILGITAADFNGDGHPDLAAISYGENGALSVLLGTGDGRLAPPRTVPIESGPVDVVTGDFDGNGRPDLAITTTREFVSVLPGLGDGTFGPGITQQVASPLGRLVVGDFNGDRRADLVAVESLSNRLLLWTGNGDGSLSAPVPRGLDAPARSIATGDLNRDGHADLVAALPSLSSVATRTGLGDGSFRETLATVGAVSGASVVGIADMNHDGHDDLVVAGAGQLGESGVSILRGRGDGTWQAWVEDPPRGLEPSLLALAVADMNGDGHGDLVQFDTRYLVVSRGLGTGAFTRPPTNLFLKPGVQAFASADLNGDGVADLAGLSPSATPVTVWINGANGRFASVRSYAAGPEPAALAIHDLDRDGAQDLVVVDKSEGKVAVLLGSPDGTFAPGASGPAGTLPNSITLADFDQDGLVDAAVAGRNGAEFLRGNGDGTFREPAASPAGWFPWAVTGADFNRDGKPDLALLARAEPGSDAAAAVLLGSGDGTFGAPSFLQAGLEPYSVLAGDLDGDGNPDLAVGNYASGSVSVLAGRGDGTFKPASEYFAGANASRFSPPSAQLMALADIDEDGRTDVLVGNMGTGVTTILRNVCDAPPSPIRLAITATDSGLRLSWPATEGRGLESATRLDVPDWTPAPEPAVTVDGQATVSLPPHDRERYFRLGPLRSPSR